ncbi:MAG: hypothetical protein ACM3SY_11110 [Candidatus Omnitrophota bacterium]
MKASDNLKGSAALLGLSIDDLFNEIYKAVEEKDAVKLGDIDVLLKRHFCKKIAQFQIEELEHYNKLLVHFLIWFNWGGVPKWDQAVPVVNKLDTILELSQLIAETESPQKAYKELKKSSYGVPLVKILFDNKMMKPGEIREALHIKTMQQVSNLLNTFEKAGIVVREIDGKNVWVSLGMPGMAIYREYLKPEIDFNSQITKALRSLNSNNIEESKKTIQQLIKEEPDNPLLIYLLGIITLNEEEKLLEAGKLLAKAVLLGLDAYKGLLIGIFAILQNNDEKLDFLKNRLIELNFYGDKDKIADEINPTLQILAWLYAYLGNTARAKEYDQLVKKNFRRMG